MGTIVAYVKADVLDLCLLYEPPEASAPAIVWSMSCVHNGVQFTEQNSDAVV